MDESLELEQEDLEDMFTVEVEELDLKQYVTPSVVLDVILLTVLTVACVSGGSIDGTI